MFHFANPETSGREGDLESLAAGLFWPPDARVLVMWGYYDESGEHGPTGELLNMTIGGCFSSLERWREFDAAWKAALAAESLSYFHMTDFEAWEGPFNFTLPDGSRDKEKHNRLLNALLDIMLEHIDGFFGFGAVSMFEPNAPRKDLTHRRLMTDCMHGAIKNAVLDVADDYQQPLNLVFGKNSHFPERDMNGLVDFYDYGAAKGRIETCTTGDPKKISPLQAADIFAYEMARAQRKGRPERYPFQKLLDGAKVRNLRFLMYWGPIRSREIKLSGVSGKRRP
jgi:hypothetical protein